MLSEELLAFYSDNTHESKVVSSAFDMPEFESIVGPTAIVSGQTMQE